MKLKPIILLPLIYLFALSSCDYFKHASSSTSSSESISSNVNSSLSTSQDISSEPSSEIVSSENTSTSNNESSSADISKLKVLTLDEYDGDGAFDYSTGSFGSFYSNYQFNFYRAYKSNNELLHLIPYTSITNVEGLASSFYNFEPIYGIEQISLTYRTSSNNSNKPYIRYDENKDLNYKIDLDLSTSIKTVDINLNNANYFSIETTNVQLDIIELTIYYDNVTVSIDNTKKGSGEDKYRINLPSVDENELIHNVTKVTMPTKIQRNGDQYVVLEEKEYTYYSYQGVKNDLSLVEEATLIDPVDICNYFIAFNQYPVNYVYKNEYNTAYRIFKDDTRCVSTYTRTDGYATSVPYKAGSDGKPYYYELDLDLDGTYSNNSRGCGRLVCWEYGFDENKGAVGYEQNQMVIVYTDDHYATFKEYYGAGLFSDTFDSEMNRTNTKWSNPLTLTKE